MNFLIFKIKRVLMASFLFFFSLSALVENSPLEVNLNTETTLLPLYVAPFTQESSFSSTYLKQLEEVLIFDLSHNGSTYVVPQQHLLDQWLQDSLKNKEEGTTQNLSYGITGHLKGSNLSLTLFDNEKKTVKVTETLALTGQLDKDRLVIHRLADATYKNFFGVEGIASTHLLYALRNQIGKDSTKWISEIWQSDYDGANARQLTQENSYCLNPVYLPPKTGHLTGGFLYVSYQMGQPKIYLSSLKESKGRRLLSLNGNQLMPALAATRDKVAFISDVTGNPDLFLQPFSLEEGLSGKPQQIFSSYQATQGSPTFHPDGKKIAFVSNKEGSPKIYIIDIPSPGSSLKKIKPLLITKRNKENSAPAWSPDGKKIAYCARSTADRQIWIYDVETQQETQLTQGMGHKENPSWAPNSLTLVYNSSNQDQSELFLINLFEKQSVKISSGRGEKRFPHWEPKAQ